MSKDNHSFSIAVANEVGVPGAILIQHLLFLQKANVSGAENWQEKWVRRSAASLQKTYSYWSLKQIATITDSLEKGGYVASKIENKERGDRSKSYLLTEKGILLMGEKPLAEMENGTPIPLAEMENGTPIPLAEMENGLAETENDISPNGGMLIKVNCTSFVPSFVEEKSAAKPLSSPFKKTNEFLDLEEKEKPLPPVAPAPPPVVVEIRDPETPGAVIYDHITHKGYPTHEPAGEFKRVNIGEEVERMRNDPAALEGFVIGRKLPRDKFAEYLEAFEVEQVGLETKYKDERALRLHFQNWSSVRFEMAQRKATQLTRSKIVPLGGASSRYGEKQKF